MDQKEKEHLLALKVMRLTRPTITTLTPFMSCDECRDLPLDSFSKNHEIELDLLPRFPQLSLTSDFLTLPQNFGTIFLGESFMGYINVNNQSESICSDVLIKIDLQTGSQKLSLSGGGDPPIPLIAPEESIDQVIKHEIKELGTHILVCSVSYMPPDGERMYFRKFFKFHVYKPLDVKTKFYNIKNDNVYLEAQLQNITLSPIFLESVTLDPCPNFEVHEIHSLTKNNPFGPSRLMNSQDIRQFLFRLTSIGDVTNSGAMICNVGKLDIVWFVNGGERGRLQTSQLQRNIPPKEDLKLRIDMKHDPGKEDYNNEDIDKKLLNKSIDQNFSFKVGKEYKLPIVVTNNTNRGMDLKLNLVNPDIIKQEFVWHGVSGKFLGNIESHCDMKFTLSIKPLVTGLIKITGLQLIDIFLKRVYDFDDVIQIFVTS